MPKPRQDLSVEPLTPEQAALVANSERLIGYMLNHLGGVPLACDEDVRQEARLELVRSVRKWRPGGGAKWSTYALKAIRNAATVEWRKRYAKMRGGSGTIGTDRWMAHHADVYALEAVIPAPQEDDAPLTPSLRGLSPKQKLAVEMTLAGFNPAETAKHMACSRQNVNYLLAGARKKLAKRVASQENA